MLFSLQSQLSVKNEELTRIRSENRELTEFNTQMELVLRERMEIESAQNKQLRNLQLDFSTLRGQYEKTVESQRDLESLAADEQAMRMSAESRLHAANEALENLRLEYRATKIKSDNTTVQLQQCDNELAQAVEQLSKYGRDMTNLVDTNEKLRTADATIGVLKGDISRLLRLLEHYPASTPFVRRWQESEGLSFTGIGSDQAVEGANLKSFKYKNQADALLDMRTSIESLEKGGNKEDYSNMTDSEAWATVGLSPADLARLKKQYNMDPFPLPGKFEDEVTLWVPHEAANAGMKFLTSKIPHAPPSVIMDFLRKMNKIWCRREMRRMGELRDDYEKRMYELKRKANAAKPYRKVLQTKQVKRLKSALLKERTRYLNGKPKRKIEKIHDIDANEFDEADFEADVAPHDRRLCMQSALTDASSRRKASITAVSTEKLLEASLVSLETIGKHSKMAGSNRHTHSGGGSYHKAGIEPSEEYLRGSLWLGRNMTMLMEELAEAMICFRMKHLSEVAAASNDSDVHRCVRRLNLLASAGITEATALTNSSRLRARELLQGVADIYPGDKVALNDMMVKMPIESAYQSTGRGVYIPVSPGPNPRNVPMSKNSSNNNSPLASPQRTSRSMS